MAQEVKIAGATFSNVPSIRVPDSNGTFHSFMDTSDANAVAGDIAQGKTAYVNGVKITGTSDNTSLVITDTTDSHGGTIRTITGKVVQLQTKTITPTSSVQVVDPDDGYDGFSQVTVNAGGSSINNQNKTVTPTTSQQSITADSGYTGLGTVTVNAMPSGSVTTPSSISGTSATVTTGTNTLTLTKSVSVTPNVTTAGYISSGTAGNSSVSLTASVTTKAAATITPSTTNQTIASGTYLTGTQTIAGDTDLVAGNIKKDVQIFGVTGTYEGSGGSSKNVQISQTQGRAASSTYTAVGPSITVSKTGKYDVYWTGYRSSTSGTNGSQLYIGSTAYGSAKTTFNTGSGLTNLQYVHLSNVSLTQNQVLTIHARSRGNNYYMYILDLVIIEA